MTTPRDETSDDAPFAGSIKDQVYRALKADLLGGTFDMGERLNEGQLTARYGVSRAPLREALTMLQHDGLLEVLPRVGYVTSRTTPQDIMDIFELRTLIEGATVHKAAKTISEAQLHRLSELCSPFDPTDAASLRHHLDENLEFHRIIAVAAGNRRMTEILIQLMEHMFRLIVLRLGQSTGEDVAAEHAQIAAALTRRDAEQAHELIVQHLNVARQATIDAMLRLIANRHL